MVSSKVAFCVLLAFAAVAAYPVQDNKVVESNDAVVEVTTVDPRVIADDTVNVDDIYITTSLPILVVREDVLIPAKESPVVEPVAAVVNTVVAPVAAAITETKPVVVDQVQVLETAVKTENDKKVAEAKNEKKQAAKPVVTVTEVKVPVVSVAETKPETKVVVEAVEAKEVVPAVPVAEVSKTEVKTADKVVVAAPVAEAKTDKKTVEPVKTVVEAVKTVVVEEPTKAETKVETKESPVVVAEIIGSKVVPVVELVEVNNEIPSKKE